MKTHADAFASLSILYIGTSPACCVTALQEIASRCANFYSTTEAAAAKKLFARQRPDLVLSDLDLPDREGLELLRHFRRMDSAATLIALTTDTNPETMIETIRIGIHDYFVQPVEAAEFMVRLENTAETIRLAHLNRQNLLLLEQYKKVVDVANVVTKTNPDGIITYANDHFLKISGYTREELIGNTHRILRHPETPKETFVELWRTITAKKVWRGTITNRRKDGSSYIVNATIVPILDETGKIIEYIALRQDITRLIEQEQTIRRQSTDDLTLLPNRQKLLEELHGVKYPNLALFNIDNFRDINDLYGFETGDFILKEFAALMQNSIRSSDCRLYKLPSDEFAVLIDSAEDIFSYQERIKNLMEHIGRHDFMFEENSVHVSVTVGIAHGGPNILASADIALQDARKLKRPLMVYDESRRSKEHTEQNLFWNREIKSAIKHNRIVPFFQPICDTRSGKVEKYEALVRLIDSSGETISPFFFLDIAKKYRLYEHITRAMVRKTFAHFAALPFEFSLNLAIEDILDLEMVSFIKGEISRFPEPRRIVFEITESEGIENYTDIQLFINDIKSLGCKIAIDDFGTGYSNFEYILKLDIDYLKIDGSLVKSLPFDKDARVVVETILSFAQKLGIQTITEFVNSEECFAMVNQMGSDFVQGYFIGEPSTVTTALQCRGGESNASTGSYVI